MIGRAQYKTNKIKEAILTFKNILNIESSYKFALNSLGIILFRIK